MDLYKFLEQLSANNNRPWMAEHKSEYEQLRGRFLEQVQQLIYAMAAFDPALAGVEAKDCVYRINRDIRFSPDKSPYKCYFSAAISPSGRHCPLAGYYLQLDCREEQNGLYGGIWMPEPSVLKKLRHAIADNAEEWEEILAAPGMQQYWQQWCNIVAPLKVAPAGWPKDHPQIEYLRRRDLGKQCTVSRDFFRSATWPQAAAERFAALKPFIDFINYTITEE